MKTYAVHSVFWTVQGEGLYAGTPALFVRFSGCNVWDGDEAHRERDTARGACARFCDTKFKGVDPAQHGGHYTSTDLANLAVKLIPEPKPGMQNRVHVVFTGGEPALQVDNVLVERFRQLYPSFFFEMETNGSVSIDKSWAGENMHVTISPKPPMQVRTENLAVAKAVKLLYPVFASEVDDCEHLYPNAVLFVQPVDGPLTGSIPNEGACVNFVKKNPGWRLSTQIHKYLGIP